MHRGQNLHRGTEQRVVTDSHAANVKHNAIEVEENSTSQFDVGSVITVERRLHPDSRSATPEELCANESSYFLISFARSIQHQAQVARATPRGDQVGV